MAFSKGNSSESTESNFKLYTGVAPVTVLGVNPKVQELSKILGREVSVDKAPVYTGTTKNGKPYFRIDIWVKTNIKELGDEQLINKISFFLSPEIRYNNAGDKTQVVNNYGQFGWVTEEGYKQQIPPYDNFHCPFRACYQGEEALTKFLMAYLNIPSLSNWKDGVAIPKTKEELKDCECSFSVSDMQSITKGNAQPIKDVIDIAMTGQEVKVIFTVTENDNKKFQNIYSNFFTPNTYKAETVSRNFTKEMNTAVQYNPNIKWSIEFKEYKETPTTFESSSFDVDNPWC